MLRCLVLVVCCMSAQLSASMLVKINSPTTSYSHQLLNLALSKRPEASSFELQAMDIQEASLDRRIRMLQQKQYIDVLALAVTLSRMENLQAIQQPIKFGMQGIRILLTTKNKIRFFDEMGSIDDLRKLQAGFVYGWADMTILMANRIPTHFAPHKESVYSMLSGKRIDYFPRSADEVYANYTENVATHPELAIEPSMALYYPLPVYYFVEKHNNALAQTISAGLEAALADGSMEKLFLQHYGDSIRKLNLDNRKLIYLKNPDLPENIVLPELIYTLNLNHP